MHKNRASSYIDNVSIFKDNYYISDANINNPITDDYGVTYFYYYTDEDARYVYYKCGNKFLNYSIAEGRLYYGALNEGGNIVSDEINQKTIIFDLFEPKNDKKTL